MHTAADRTPTAQACADQWPHDTPLIRRTLDRLEVRQASIDDKHSVQQPPTANGRTEQNYIVLGEGTNDSLLVRLKLSTHGPKKAWRPDPRIGVEPQVGRRLRAESVQVDGLPPACCTSNLRDNRRRFVLAPDSNFAFLRARGSRSRHVAAGTNEELPPMAFVSGGPRTDVPALRRGSTLRPRMRENDDLAGCHDEIFSRIHGAVPRLVDGCLAHRDCAPPPAIRGADQRGDPMSTRRPESHADASTSYTPRDRGSVHASLGRGLQATGLTSSPKRWNSAPRASATLSATGSTNALLP